jgi:hypothetical protein
MIEHSVEMIEAVLQQLFYVNHSIMFVHRDFATFSRETENESERINNTGLHKATVDAFGKKVMSGAPETPDNWQLKIGIGEIGVCARQINHFRTL